MWSAFNRYCKPICRTPTLVITFPLCVCVYVCVCVCVCRCVCARARVRGCVRAFVRNTNSQTRWCSSYNSKFCRFFPFQLLHENWTITKSIGLSAIKPNCHVHVPFSNMQKGRSWRSKGQPHQERRLPGGYRQCTDGDFCSCPTPVQHDLPLWRHAAGLPR